MTSQPASMPTTLRIGPKDLKTRMNAGEGIVILDTRNQDAWQRSDLKIRGAQRVDAHDFHPDPSLSKDQMFVAYCT